MNAYVKPVAWLVTGAFVAAIACVVVARRGAASRSAPPKSSAVQASASVPSDSQSKSADARTSPSPDEEPTPAKSSAKSEPAKEETVKYEEPTVEEDTGDAPPPFWLYPQRVKSVGAVLNRTVMAAQTNGGAGLDRIGLQLLDSTNALLRAAGAVMLVEALGKLDDSILDRLLADEDITVPLTLLGWLQDMRKSEIASSILDKWKQKGLDPLLLMEALDSGPIESGAGRAALKLIKSSVAPEEAQDFFNTVARDASQTYSVRLEAAMLLRDVMPFDEYQAEIESIAGAARHTQEKASARRAGPPSDAGTPPGRPSSPPSMGGRSRRGQSPEESPSSPSAEGRLWQTGISKLANNVRGPVEVMQGPPRVMVDDVDIAFGQPTSTTLEDFSLALDYALSRDDALIQKGVTDSVNGYLADIKKQRLPDEQQVLVRRLEAQLTALPAKERDDIPPLFNDAPP
jgi:hypothetical protein